MVNGAKIGAGDVPFEILLGRLAFANVSSTSSAEIVMLSSFR